jgi:excisionase family DNA binding protein
MTLIQILESKQKALTVREVVELLGVSKTHVYEMVADGRLPSFRLGRSIRIDASDIAELLRNQKPAVAPDQLLKNSKPRKHFDPRSNRDEKRSAGHFLRKRINCLEAAAAMENPNAK